MIDLEAIRAWVKANRGDEYCRDVIDAIEHIDALLAEVERLRDPLGQRWLDYRLNEQGRHFVHCRECENIIGEVPVGAIIQFDHGCPYHQRASGLIHFLPR